MKNSSTKKNIKLILVLTFLIGSPITVTNEAIERPLLVAPDEIIKFLSAYSNAATLLSIVLIFFLSLISLIKKIFYFVDSIEPKL